VKRREESERQVESQKQAWVLFAASLYNVFTAPPSFPAACALCRIIPVSITAPRAGTNLNCKMSDEQLHVPVYSLLSACADSNS
jgi:hypothetical protein